MAFLTFKRSVKSFLLVLLTIIVPFVVSAQETVSGDERTDRKIPKL